MNTTHKTSSAAKASALRLLRRTASAAAVVAVVAAAIAAPITAPEPTSGSAPMVIAIARADCPPDCGGNPGGGTPSGPPGGGTEFVPPSMPAMPSYEPGRGQPPMDQNNGISIYNSAAPQPSQAALPSQAPVQNQDGSYNRAANGEQQPINYKQAPDNQGINNDWQRLSDQLNNSPGQNEPNQPSNESDQDRCDQLWSALGNLTAGGGDNSAVERQSEDITSALTAECGTLSAANPRQNSIGRLNGPAREGPNDRKWDCQPSLSIHPFLPNHLEWHAGVTCTGPPGWQPRTFTTALQQFSFEYNQWIAVDTGASPPGSGWDPTATFDGEYECQPGPQTPYKVSITPTFATGPGQENTSAAVLFACT